jgi:hypothetical protein
VDQDPAVSPASAALRLLALAALGAFVGAGGTSGRLQLGLELGHPGLHLLLGGARLGRHGAHRVELLARHEIEIGGHALDPLAHPRLDLLAEPAQGVEGTARDPGQIVEQAVVGLHHDLLRRGARRNSASIWATISLTQAGLQGCSRPRRRL